MLSPAYPIADPLAMAWRLPHGLGLAFRQVGDMAAVFNEESEDTHLLHPLAGVLVRRLASGEMLEGEALRDVAASLEQAGYDPALVLRELHVLGLAEPFQP